MISLSQPLRGTIAFLLFCRTEDERRKDARINDSNMSCHSSSQTFSWSLGITVFPKLPWKIGDCCHKILAEGIYCPKCKR